MMRWDCSVWLRCTASTSRCSSGTTATSMFSKRTRRGSPRSPRAIATGSAWTLRTYDAAMRDDLIARLRRTVAKTTEAAGASAEVTIEQNAPVTWNDPALTRRMVPTLEWAAGAEQVAEGRAQTVAEDFAYFQQEVPGMYFLLGVNAEGVDAGEAAPNHSPQFHVNEGALVTGVRALTGLAIDYLQPGG